MNRVGEITSSTQFIGGEIVKNFQTRLAQEAEVAEARVCANGTDAIQIALRAVGVGNGDVVVIPDSTFWATFEAVCNVGAKPVTVDIDPTDLHPSVSIIEEAILKYRPKAVILVHLYGWAARDTFAIRKLCIQKEIPLIEDSAQAWGTRINGESVFTNALISTTSFYPGKVLGAAGDGGALFMRDSNLAELAHKFANHGRESKYQHSLVGWNSRLDTLQAAYLDLALDYTPARIQSRRYAAQWYRDNVHVKGIDFLSPGAGVEENGYISVAKVSAEFRPTLMKKLDAAQIGYAVVYPGPMHEQKGAQGWILASLNEGHTRRNCDSIINLPCFSGITVDELQYVKAHLERAFS